MANPRVAVVIPTVQGRTEHLDRCVAAYERTAPDAWRIIVEDRPSCGQAWIDGAELAGGCDYIHFTADDLEPHDGWLDTALETVDRGYIPAPLVFHPDGRLESAGLEGFSLFTGPHTDWQFVDGTTVPFLTREMWERIGMLDIHYCSDKLVSTRGRAHGWETVIRTGMRFTHYTAQAGRDYGRVQTDTEEYIRRVDEVAAR